MSKKQATGSGYQDRAMGREGVGRHRGVCAMAVGRMTAGLGKGQQQGTESGSRRRRTQGKEAVKKHR